MNDIQWIFEVLLKKKKLPKVLHKPSSLSIMDRKQAIQKRGKNYHHQEGHPITCTGLFKNNPISKVPAVSSLDWQYTG